MKFSGQNVKIATYLGLPKYKARKIVGASTPEKAWKQLSSFEKSGLTFKQADSEQFVFFNIEETPENVEIRFLSALRWAIDETEFDYIWHTNVSTYLNIPAVLDFLRLAGKNNFYGGFLGNSDVDFVSGAGICLSRDVVERILREKFPDISDFWDVNLGYLMQELNIQPISIQRIEFTTVGEITHFSEEELLQNLNFRCKTKWNRTGDIEIMKALDEIIGTKVK